MSRYSTHQVISYHNHRTLLQGIDEGQLVYLITIPTQETHDMPPRGSDDATAVARRGPGSQLPAQAGGGREVEDARLAALLALAHRRGGPVLILGKRQG